MVKKIFKILTAQLGLVLVVVATSIHAPNLKSNWRVVEEELLDCVIEDNSCTPNDGESLGDDRRCCSGYSNSRNICEGGE